MSQTTNLWISWENGERWADQEPTWGEDEDDEELRLGGTLSGMSLWDALINELEIQRCGRA